MSLEDRFQEYFDALDRSRQQDRCWICCRTPAEVKLFFGFEEDGTPVGAAEFEIEDVAPGLEDEIMSYRGPRPICAVCQLNFDAIFASGERDTLLALLVQMQERRDELWPEPGQPG